MNLRSVEDTELFQRLRDSFKGTAEEPDADHLAHNVRNLCGEAADHMKTVPADMPQYTLHDSVHLLRVTELMARVAGRSIENLNPVEIALLILSANFHDHGMVLSSSENAELENNANFRLFRDNWRLEHSNLRDVEVQLRSPQLNDEEKTRLRRQEAELLRGMKTEFIRRTHAGRSRQFISKHHSHDPRWTISGTSMTEIVGVLAESHGHGTDWMTETRGFHVDRDVGKFQVNVPYLGVLLRLADILDLDRDRTPDLIYKAIHFTSQVSITEWEKHRSVQGWSIEPNLIRYTMAFEHPVYERTARRFMDWIDEELVSSHAVVARFPPKVVSKHQLELPQRVDRTRIGPKNNAYRYHDLEFSLSRDELVKLLMTDRLYSSPSLCVRELLQNALDALRYRKALYATEKLDWKEGTVRFEHRLDDAGCEVLSCTDNGVGMDEEIIERFLTRAGRSFYRSPEFERERVRFRAANVDFDPCARFGIGFMSCFMLGDRIRITTRRDHGPGRTPGEALVVDINGLDSMLVIRNGPADQPLGTTVEITGRKKPSLFDPFTDRVRLCAVLDGYALATEFPISGECTIDEVRGRVTIPTTPTIRSSPIEGSGVQAMTTLVQPLVEIDRRLGGEIRVSFLTDERGLPTVANAEASWRYVKNNGNQLVLLNAEGTRLPLHDSPFHSATCLDGILVAGFPGRGHRRSLLLGARANPIDVGDTFFMDVRGDLKPELTPGREPLSSASDSPSWRRLQSLLFEAHAKVWEKVTARLADGLDPQVYWFLSFIHRAPIELMQAGILWSLVSIPVRDSAGCTTWTPINSVRDLKCHSLEKEGWYFELPGSGRVTLPQSLLGEEGGDRDARVDWRMNIALASMTTAIVDASGIRLLLREPTQPDARPGLGLMGSFRESPPIPIELAGSARACLSVSLPFSNVNRDHPIAQMAFASQHLEHPSDVEIFARGLVNTLCNPQVLDVLRAGEAHNNRQFRWLGHQFKSIDWDRTDRTLAPPYSVWLGLERGTFQITHQVLETWAALPHENWDLAEGEI